MTTTNDFQIYPDYYSSHAETKKRNEKVQTNPRYRYFCQKHFTAGDGEQFEQYRFLKDSNYVDKNVNPVNNIFSNQITPIWEKFSNVDCDSVDNTFKYIFHKFKKGIFVKIKDNKLAVFLPFSKASFTNEWSHMIETPSMEFLQSITEKEGYKFNPKKVNQNVEDWYSNNCLVRYEYPINESDCNIDNLKNMLEELVEKRDVPDCEFFVNKRDFPIITKDGTEPYNHIWDTDDKPLISHAYEKYIPILGMSTSSRYADIAIPNHNDWARVQSYENKWFPRTSSDYNDDFDQTKWEDKLETAVFRGGSTCHGVTVDTNLRLKAAHISSKNFKDKDKVPFLNAGITEWNLRARKIEGCDKLQTIDVESLEFGLCDFMSSQEQANYKYILHIDGHVTAFRLSMELAMRSVVLIVESQWSNWYSKMLEPYVHYVPVSFDLSDIFEKIKWCKQNDEKCKQISENARKFYEKYLCKNGILDHLQHTVVSICNKMKQPVESMVNHVDSMVEKEYWSVLKEQETYYQTDKGVDYVFQIPPIIKSHGLFVGVHEVVKKVIHESEFEKVAQKGKILFENKMSRVIHCCIANFHMAVKCTDDSRKSREHKHEAFIGTNYINKMCKKIPNFSYTFGTYCTSHSTKVISEYIQGQTLHQYLTSDKFKIPEFYNIITQLSFALKMAQQKYGFVHNDLTPWNIVLFRPPSVVEIEYKTSSDSVSTIKTKVIPTIIDYGKSNCTNHDFYKETSNSSIQDIITLILTCVKTMIQSKRTKDEFTCIVGLMNFLSNSGYMKGEIKSFKDLKKFLRVNSKYSELISSDKKTLNTKCPLDLINYLKTKVYIQHKNYFCPFMDKSSSKQVFNYIFCKDFDERLETYIREIETIKTTNLDDPNQPYMLYYNYKTSEKTNTSLLNELERFLQVNNKQISHCKCITKLKEIIQSVVKQYKKQINEKYGKNKHSDLEIYDYSEIHEENLNQKN